MLNYIATGVHRRTCSRTTSAQERGRRPRHQDEAAAVVVVHPAAEPAPRGSSGSTCRRAQLNGFLIGAILLGIGFYVLVWRTRFGFDLRASGANPAAARAAGVNPKSMIMKTMLISGALAGLVGHRPAARRPAVPPLHRAVPARPSASPASRSRSSVATIRSGIAFAALLFAYIERAHAGASPCSRSRRRSPRSCRARSSCRRSSPTRSCVGPESRPRCATQPAKAEPRAAAGGAGGAIPEPVPA